MSTRLAAGVCAWMGFLMLANPATGEDAAMKLHPFELSEVRILDGPLKTAMELDRDYLLSLDNDSLLYAFRQNAGLPTPGTPLSGWEAPSCEVRGHFVGHHLSACAMGAVSLGDERLREKGATLVAELAKCQQALGGKYLSAFPETFWTRLETRTASPWAPYYTIHKIMRGFLDQYELCGNAQALEVVKGMAAYFKERNDKFTNEEMNKILDTNEEGGMCDVLWSLYAVTKDPDHMALADKMEKRSFLGPMARGEDILTGRHANTHIPLAIGAMRRYELTGETQYLDAGAYFWDRAVTPRAFATGGITNWEAFGEPYKLAKGLSHTNHETCKTHNLLKLARELFCVTGNPEYAEYYERAFLNGIMGTQDPKSGMLEYYVPMQNGHKRVYGNALDTFWCCYGTGVETWVKTNDSIYFKGENTLYVNLFIPSELTWKDKGLSLQQTTGYPLTPQTSLKMQLDKPETFALAIRIPAWLKRTPGATLNGKPVEIDAAPGTFWTLNREWSTGDTLALEFPMDLRAIPMPDDPNLIAVAYGPMVLAGIIDDGRPVCPVHSSSHVFAQPEVALVPKTYFVANTPGDLSWLTLVDKDRVIFRAKGHPQDMDFAPFYQVTDRPYGIYWPVVSKDSPRETALALENEALAFLGDSAKPESDMESMQTRYAKLADNPKLTPYRERLTFAMADLLMRNDKQDSARELLRDYAEPFVSRDNSEAIWKTLGAPDLETMSPLLLNNEISDGSGKVVELDGKKCVVTDLAGRKGHIYFAIPPQSPLKGATVPVRMEVVCRSADDAPTKFFVEYNASNPEKNNPAYQPSNAVEIAQENGWTTVVIECPNATLAGRQNLNADFRLNCQGPGNIAIAAITITYPKGFFGEVFKAFDDWAAEAESRVDGVIANNETSEREHGLKGEGTVAASHLGKGWRHATEWWSWRMKVPADKAAKLACIYWGSDVNRKFDIEIDGIRIATVALNNPKPNHFIRENYAIPEDLTKGKDAVVVTFRKKAGFAGGVFAAGIVAGE